MRIMKVKIRFALSILVLIGLNILAVNSVTASPSPSEINLGNVMHSNGGVVLDTSTCLPTGTRIIISDISPNDAWYSNRNDFIGRHASTGSGYGSEFCQWPNGWWYGGVTVDDGPFAGDHYFYEISFNYETSKIGFQNFVPKATLVLKPKKNDDRLTVAGTFSLGAASDGIAPLTEEVTLKIGGFSTTIPAHSFKLKAGKFSFSGILSSVQVNMTITTQNNVDYIFSATAKDTDFTKIKLPIGVSLGIGNDGSNIVLKTENVTATP